MARMSGGGTVLLLMPLVVLSSNDNSWKSKQTKKPRPTDSVRNLVTNGSVDVSCCCCDSLTSLHENSVPLVSERSANSGPPEGF
ncbi:hypothetical protein Q1695_006751 [Nippostrongylus brasiliensis]|nr:hypothetical protein Q1695_006751 [Nippostrongylus brasiliensis]